MVIMKTFSPYAIPIVIPLYMFLPFTRSALMIHMITSSIIGCVNIIQMSSSILIKVISILGHLLLFAPILYFKIMYKPNIFSFIILIFLTLLFLKMPWWPYEFSRKKFILIYWIIYTHLFIILINKCGNPARTR